MSQMATANPIPPSVATARQELLRISHAASSSSLDASNLVPPSRSPREPVVVTVVERVVQEVQVPVGVQSIESSTLPSRVAPVAPAITETVTRSSAGASSSSSSSRADVEEEEELSETAAAELRRLEGTVREMTEVNDRIMAQNIALLADLEAAQRSVRDLKGEKDALAVQLRSALQKLAALNAQG
jgi:hypothetical protein